MIQEAESDTIYTFTMIVFIVLFLVLLFVIGYYLSKKFIPEKEKSTKSKLYDDLKSVSKNDSKDVVNNKVNSEIKKGKEEVPIQKESKPVPEMQKVKEEIPNQKEVTPVPQVKKVENYHWTNQIRYEPSDLFIQSEPFTYPYVLMPKNGCKVTLPKEGGSFRRGFTEDKFFKTLESYFNTSIECSNYKVLLPIGNRNGKEPDIAIIDSKNNLNLYIDVEIDEPYEGLNDIVNRKPTHYDSIDSSRNKEFTENGWIVIRFAEIQIHQTPVACCQFIAQVINSVNPNFTFQLNKYNQDKLEIVKQWSKTMAKIWSDNKYREKYLGIHSFGSYEVEEIFYENEVYEHVEIVNEPIEPSVEQIVPEATVLIEIPSKQNYKNSQYISFEYQNEFKLIKIINDSSPISIYGFCYISNSNLYFDFEKIKNSKSLNSYYSQKVINRNTNLNEVKECINNAIAMKKSIRIVYAKQERNYINIDEETGEIFYNHVEGEVNLRSVSDIGLAINVLSAEEIFKYSIDENYVTGFCNLQDEQRTFKFQRIREIEVLKI
jgi:hypothetical protein